MGADSKSLSWAVMRLGRDMRAQSVLRQRLTASLASLLAARLAPKAGETWASRLERGVQERQGGQFDVDAAQPLCMGAEHMTGADSASRRGPRKGRASHARAADAPRPPQPRKPAVRRRRWAAWKSASSWDFPTLNSSFPFTIPSIPVSVFLFAHPGGHGAVPAGVMMPAGLGTSARKFHSMSLTRQPGVPFDSEEGGESPLTDTAALSAQILRADAAIQAALSQHGRKAAAAPGSRRSDGAGGGLRSRTPKNFMFAHAATGIPKHENRVPLPKQAVLQGRRASVIDPDADELATSAGEDAFFHRADALGIADGVGGWAGVKDADPSLFARRLMHHVCREVQRYEDIDDELFSYYFEAAPVDVLRRAYEITADEMEALAMRGSSTACVVVLRGDELRVANLGDCGLTVVRQGDMVYRTEEQQHSFNFPYQLGTEAHSDSPSDAQVFRLKIQKGDVIIVGSDGVFDNLFDEDILEEVNQHLPPMMRAAGEPELRYSTDSLWYEAQQSQDKLAALCRSGGAGAAGVVAPAADGSQVVVAPPIEGDASFSLPQFHVDPGAISRAIAQRARLVSEDTRFAESPFQMRAMQEGLYYQGGKRDDITVIVAVVTDLEDTPDRR